nr:serine protease [Sphingomonas sp. CROZ-RG-20F-R02-07]
MRLALLIRSACPGAGPRRGTWASLAFLLLLVLLPGPAHADDIGATARGVVRVVTIAVVDGQVVGFGHGSGFAVAPNRIVTNAHVVELAERYPANVVIGVVPSEGAKSYQGHVVAYDAHTDLALIEFKGGTLPPAALYTGPVGEGDAVVALGYPGNVDVATAQSAADYIHPVSPVRSEGGFSARRSLSGVDVLLHTASIARGNSGGPLLDRCGRVIGVNSAITQGEQGDSNFGFAIAESELARFLGAAKQPYAAIGTACTSIEDRLRQDAEADARSIADATTARHDAATHAAMAREDALAKARNAAERGRENVMALAGLLLVAGALTIGGAGLLELRGRRRAAIWTAVAGTLGMLAAVIVFLARPSGDVTVPAEARASTIGSPAPDTALGAMTCTLIPERSRLTVSPGTDVALSWGQGGCADGRTQFAANGTRWERLVVPDDVQTISALRFDPATRIYSDTRYLMSEAGMAAARAARGPVQGRACSADPQVASRIAQQQEAIRATLPPLPNEKLVYSCSKR